MAPKSGSESPASGASARCRVAVLLSGNGSNLQAIIDANGGDAAHADICLVVSDQPSAYGLERARKAGIPGVVFERGDFASRDEFESAIVQCLERAHVELVVLAGFMRILGKAFVSRFRGRMLNIHPSLLPKYRGLDTYRRALDAGERWHGTSVHFVTEELDGGPVIAQARVRIEPEDYEGSLRKRVLACEHSLYPRVVEWFCRGWLAMNDDRVVLRGDTLEIPVLLDEAGATEAL